MSETTAPTPTVDFTTHPDQYVHWKLAFDGPIARLSMDVQEDHPLREGYVLKLNSYDLGVDIELADAIQRIRFEHPEVRCVIVDSAKDRIFCAGANINMLATSGHAFKVNFCKFTNETRLALEDMSASSGVRSLAALNGITAGGGYELALACDEIYLVEDGNSAVSLPEVPLLGVLPGTGGLTRVVDKRKVRRDRADVFCTLAEGIKGKRAEEWDLVDRVIPRSKFDDAVAERAQELAAEAAAAHPERTGPGVVLDDLAPEVSDTGFVYRHVTVTLDPAARTATMVVRAPAAPPPADGAAMHAAGADLWALRCFREIDDALLRLRLNHLEIGLLILRTEGDAEQVAAWDAALEKARAEHWFAAEVVAFMARTLRRLDLTAKSIFAFIDEGSCFAGSLLELALASDRSYMLEDEDGNVTLRTTPMNAGPFPMSNGLTRLQSRFLAEPERTDAALAAGPLAGPEAEEAGLVTFSLDDIDYEDEIRVAVEERVSLSPDSLTGMEANLRFAGGETPETKVFGRLSAWQNWIFQRPNAVGERGALTMYGKPERPAFDWNRT